MLFFLGSTCLSKCAIINTVIRTSKMTTTRNTLFFIYSMVSFPQFKCTRFNNERSRVESSKAQDEISILVFFSMNKAKIKIVTKKSEILKNNYRSKNEEH